MSWHIHTIGYLYGGQVQAGLRDGRWVRAVPEPYTAARVKAAWAVLTGKAYAFKWPEPGELEEALEGRKANRADANNKSPHNKGERAA